ncbi:ATP-binding protein [Streptomyces sp. NPDC057674]|uniref:ATP-binding protein n=1 Tax=Streptomyces sp. NPDC057674 TaxID=3346203 RepID=UPI0036D1809B
MDPINRGPEEYGHDSEGDDARQGRGTPAPAPAPARARVVRLVSGDLLVTVNPVDGSEIEPCPPGHEPAAPRPRTAEERAEAARAAAPPVPPGPAAPTLPLLERKEQRERLVGILGRGRSARLSGPAGSGRTALLAAVAADCADLAPDGVVRLSGHHRTPAELLHELFAAVRHAPDHRPGKAALHERLREIGAVVVVDDLEFGGAALDEFLAAAPECAFLLAAGPDTPAPSADSHVEDLHLAGLGRGAALKLLESAVGRTLTDDEANWAGDLWFESEGLPLRFVQAGALLRQRDRLRVTPAESDALLAALSVLVAGTGGDPDTEAEHRATAVLLARAAAPAFAAGLHWGAWERALRAGQEAARLTGEVAEEAYFHHELGVLALCAGNLERARAELEASIGMRGVLADKRGTVAGRRALALVADLSGEHAAPAATRAEEPVSPPRGIPSLRGPGRRPAADPFPVPPPAGAAGAMGAAAPAPLPGGPGRGPAKSPMPAFPDFADEGPTLITRPDTEKGAGRPSLRGGIVSGARRNLAAVGAGALLVAVLGTVVTLGATSGNGEDPATNHVTSDSTATDDTTDDGIDGEEQPAEGETGEPGRTGDATGSGSPSPSASGSSATSNPRDPSSSGTPDTSGTPSSSGSPSTSPPHTTTAPPTSPTTRPSTTRPPSPTPPTSTPPTPPSTPPSTTPPTTTPPTTTPPTTEPPAEENSPSISASSSLGGPPAPDEATGSPTPA